MTEKDDAMPSYREFVRGKHWAMLGVAMAISLVLTGIFQFTSQTPLVWDRLWREFLVTTVFSITISACSFYIGALYLFLPRHWKVFHRHLIATALVFGAILLGTVVAGFLVAGVVGATPGQVISNVLVFNFFISGVILLQLSIYERIRCRLRDAMETLKQKEVNEQRLLQLKTQAELSSLQAKINPHFLFNSLNSIASLISVDPRSAEQVVTRLSRLLRYSLRSSLTRTVRLSEELEIVRTYLEIEKMRLGDRLHWSVKTDGDLERVQVPGMLLQPLVENSVKHGISCKVDGGCVQVSVEVGPQLCRILVEDSGVGWKESCSGGHGLSNIRERLDLFFEGVYTLETYNREGAVVEITFPLEKACHTEP